MTTSDLALLTGISNDPAAAYARVLPRMETLDKRLLEPVNIDVPRAAAMILAVLAHVARFRAQIDRAADRHDCAASLLDDLRASALAAWHACVHCGPRVRDARVKEVAARARAALRRVQLALEILEEWGLIPEQPLSNRPAPNGYTQLAGALAASVAVAGNSIQQIEANTPLRQSEILSYGMLANELLFAAGEHNDDPEAARTQRREMRQRAFTVMKRDYEELRAVVQWIRRNEGDADEIAPSLWVVKRRRAAKPGVEEPANPSVPTAP